MIRISVLFLLLAPLAFGGAAPDQVLVIYNADWTEDLDGTAPGPDSLEVARYYVEQHTDPKTGRKPHLLGLSCKHGGKKHLNHMRLPEDSQDNRLGVKLRDGSARPKTGLRTTKRVLVLNGGHVKTLDAASLVIEVSADGDSRKGQVVWADGKATPGIDFTGRLSPAGHTYGFSSLRAFPKGFTAHITAKTKAGKPFIDLVAPYHVPSDIAADTEGADGVRDDGNYLEDIEQPIKAFLEALANRRPDGALLRDHIVYIVACYGLPKQVEATYGVARGVRGNAGGGDDGSALEQRLALAYFDVSPLHQPTEFPPPSSSPQGGIFASRLRATLGGMNPYRHPKTHQKRTGKGFASHRLYPSYEYDAERIPHYTSALRRQLGPRALYGVTRIDARHPDLAKAQVDGALYGNRHLTPDLGWFWHGTYSSAPQAAEELKYFEFFPKPPQPPKPYQAGRVLFFFGNFGYSTPCAGKTPAPYERGFYPGSVSYAVRSYLGWQLTRRVSQLYDRNSRYPERMLDAGATVCALSAHGAHDTSATWPDDQVFFHHLLRGYDLAECFLMSNIYLDWLQSHVGDPLYRPALQDTEPDRTPPRVAAATDIRIEAGAAAGRAFARVRPILAVTPDNPEMVVMTVSCWREPEDRTTASTPRFSRRPRAVLVGLEPETVYHYDVALADPYGNAFSSAKAFGDLTFTTGPARPGKVIAELDYDPKAGKPRVLGVAAKSKAPNARPFLAERGELRVEFTPTKGYFKLLTDDLNEFVIDSNGLVAGGRIAAVCPAPGKTPPKLWRAGQRYALVARWRRDPVVRQLSLVAKNGQEFLLGSNNRLCWLPVQVGTRLRALNSNCVVHRLVITDDVHPGPLDPLYPPHFDLAGFEAADQEPGAKP
ncbi:hypothetical protein HQ560_18165 [bacterium]|nr:hypothetical protein [bacterium]